MNPNWPRWIYASVSTWFKSKIQTANPDFEIFITGEDRKTAGKTDWCEFRLDGPFGKQQSPKDWTLYIMVNILISSIKDQQDAHKIYKDVGFVMTGFTTNIPIFRFGDGPDDDPSVLEGCFVLRSEGGEVLSINHFGEILGDNLQMMQSTVEGHYKGLFTY